MMNGMNESLIIDVRQDKDLYYDLKSGKLLNGNHTYWLIRQMYFANCTFKNGLHHGVYEVWGCPSGLLLRRNTVYDGVFHGEFKMYDNDEYDEHKLYEHGVHVFDYICGKNKW